MLSIYLYNISKYNLIIYIKMSLDLKPQGLPKFIRVSSEVYSKRILKIKK